MGKLYVQYSDFFQEVAICGRPLPWWGGEVLGHMSNGYNSLTFLLFFSYFNGFQHCSKKMVNTNVYTNNKNVRCSASCGGGEGGGTM
jgi:hypothetical protein